eukprot:Awhi_evm1s304
MHFSPWPTYVYLCLLIFSAEDNFFESLLLLHVRAMPAAENSITCDDWDGGYNNCPQGKTWPYSGGSLKCNQLDSDDSPKSCTNICCVTPPEITCQEWRSEFDDSRYCFQGDEYNVAVNSTKCLDGISSNTIDNACQSVCCKAIPIVQTTCEIWNITTWTPFGTACLPGYAYNNEVNEKECLPVEDNTNATCCTLVCCDQD